MGAGSVGWSQRKSQAVYLAVAHFKVSREKIKYQTVINKSWTKLREIDRRYQIGAETHRIHALSLSRTDFFIFCRERPASPKFYLRFFIVKLHYVKIRRLSIDHQLYFSLRLVQWQRITYQERRRALLHAKSHFFRETYRGSEIGERIGSRESAAPKMYISPRREVNLYCFKAPTCTMTLLETFVRYRV